MSTILSATDSATIWDIDVAHSSLGFSVRHLGISKVLGRFDRWAGSVTLDVLHLERSRVTATIEAASINTHEAKRDAHLRSAEFFDAARFPTITFSSSGIEAAGQDRYRMVGDLSIAGVTGTATLEVEHLGHATDPWGAERAVFSATSTIDRRDFGLVWNQTLESGGLLIGERVELEFTVEAVRRPEDGSDRPA
jgi:polyisoprenoid-binding protein YceI